LIVLLAISIAACPLALAQQVSFAQPEQSQPQPFTRPPATFEAIFTATPPTGGGFETLNDTGDPLAGLDLENYLLIGQNVYPIGDEFTDASGIPLGPVTEDHFGWYGYATIATNPDLRLLWYTDAAGTKHYLISKVSDPLFAGNPGVSPGDGFDDYVDQLVQAENALAISLGGWASGAAGLLVAQFALCGPTAGTTCVTAALTAVAALVGGGISFMYHYIFKAIPAERNVIRQFSVIDAQTP
jgi:hypothetical protein